MHKKENLAKQLARESSKMGWQSRKELLREQKKNLIGELKQPHFSMGRGRHLARALGSRNWQAMRGRG